jgi:hypothetical protein
MNVTSFAEVNDPAPFPERGGQPTYARTVGGQ